MSRLANELVMVVSVAAALGAGCGKRTPAPSRTSPSAASDSAGAGAAAAQDAAAEPTREPVSVREVQVPGDLPAYALAGAEQHSRAAVFLAGVCGHPQGYMQSFAFAASRYGDLVGVQGDLDCAGGLRRWSGDVAAIERRIDAAFVAAGIGPPRQLTLIGYSQGAERAMALHRRNPQRYLTLVLMAGPTTPDAARIGRAKSVALLAGTRDNQALMRSGAAALARSGVRAKFFSLPGGRHGEMGEEPERTMSQVLEWLIASGP